MYCEHCGENIPEDSSFCEHCGRPVTPGSVLGAVKPAPPGKPGPGQSFFSSIVKGGSATPDYSRIVFWIQGQYGSRFTPGMDNNKARAELEAILNSEQARGVPAKALKGFRAFIAKQQYGTLIQVRR